MSSAAEQNQPAMVPPAEGPEAPAPLLSPEAEKFAKESEAKANTEAAGPSKPEEPAKLPPLSAHEFRQYNRLAEHMDQFVRH